MHYSEVIILAGGLLAAILLGSQERAFFAHMSRRDWALVRRRAMDIVTLRNWRAVFWASPKDTASNVFLLIVSNIVILAVLVAGFAMALRQTGPETVIIFKDMLLIAPFLAFLYLATMIIATLKVRQSEAFQSEDPIELYYVRERWIRSTPWEGSSEGPHFEKLTNREGRPDSDFDEIDSQIYPEEGRAELRRRLEDPDYARIYLQRAGILNECGDLADEYKKS